MAVDPVVFPLNNVQRIGGGALFRTDIQEGRSGVEVRSALWQDSRHRFNATPGIKTLDHLRIVRAFHYACNGAEIAFLLRDWSDYEVTHAQSLIPGGSGAFERGVSQAVTGSTTVFQLQKLYSNGYREHRRTIKRPQGGTVTLHEADGTLITSGYSIDYATGKATFSAPRTAPYWNGQFYVAVRFESDEINWDLIRYSISSKKGVGEMPEIGLIEDREL